MYFVNLGIWNNDYTYLTTCPKVFALVIVLTVSINTLKGVTSTALLQQHSSPGNETVRVRKTASGATGGNCYQCVNMW